jgi:hypothetical protein
MRDWLSMPRADSYLENVASLTFVALVTILIAWRAGWRPQRFWGGMAVFFSALALGPFIHVAGVNTYVPGPWAVLRYVPVIGLARTPARFSIVLVLAVAVLFASALAWVGDRWPRRRRVLLLCVAAVLVFELLPAPRMLYSAEIPRIYQHVAASSGDVRLLELPYGMRDGTASYGNFTALSQYYQTMHQKRLAGGYLSRISKRRVENAQRIQMVAALMSLSEGRPLDPAAEARLIQEGPAFAQRANIGFVMIDRTRSPEALTNFAISALRLKLVDTEGPLGLYRPAR